MSQKARLALDTAPAGFIRRCVSCIARIDPGDQFYRDLGSDDDLCVECGDEFVDRLFAVIVTGVPE